MNRLSADGDLSDEDAAALTAAIIAASPLLSAATQRPELEGREVGLFHFCSVGVAADAKFEDVVASLARMTEQILLLSERGPTDFSYGFTQSDGWIVQAFDADRESLVALEEGAWGITPGLEGALSFKLEAYQIHTSNMFVDVNVTIAAGLA